MGGEAGGRGRAERERGEERGGWVRFCSPATPSPCGVGGGRWEGGGCEEEREEAGEEGGEEGGREPRKMLQ